MVNAARCTRNALLPHASSNEWQTGAGFHRTLKKDVLAQTDITDFEHAQSLFDEWRNIYNYERPHQALGLRIQSNAIYLFFHLHRVGLGYIHSVELITHACMNSKRRYTQ